MRALTGAGAVRADISAREKLAVDAFAGRDAQVVQAESLAEDEAADARRDSGDGTADDTHVTNDRNEEAT